MMIKNSKKHKLYKPKALFGLNEVAPLNLWVQLAEHFITILKTKINFKLSNMSF